EGLWRALYQAGDVQRGFNPKRFAAVRNHLSSLVVDGEALLDWEDETYSAGQACKWRASEKLMGMIEQERERTSSTETDLVVLDEFPRPKPSWEVHQHEKQQMRWLLTEVGRLLLGKRRLAA